MRSIKLRLTDLDRSAKERPPGYLEACHAAGQIDGDWIQFTVENFAALRRQFLPLGAKPKGPSIMAMTTGLAGTVSQWLIKGGHAVTDEEFAIRRSICLTCPFWDPEAWLGHGRCLDCGCGELKPWLKTARCRQGRWPEEGVPAVFRDPPEG